LDFEDVVKCHSIKELGDFTLQYLDERGLQGPERHRTMWALFYRWRERFESGS
jgi:hypothetical protein